LQGRSHASSRGRVLERWQLALFAALVVSCASLSQYHLTILTGIRLSGDSGNHDAGRTRVCVCASCGLGAFEGSARFPHGSSPTTRSPFRARRGFVCVCTRSLACARAEQSSDMHHLSPVPHEIRPPRASFSVLPQSIVGSYAQDPDDLSQVKPEGAGNAPVEAFSFGFWTSVLQCENPAAKPRLTFNKVGIDN